MKKPIQRAALVREQQRRLRSQPTPVALWTRRLKKLRWWTAKRIPLDEDGAGLNGRECLREATQQIYQGVNSDQMYEDLLSQHPDFNEGESLAGWDQWLKSRAKAQRRDRALKRKRRGRKKDT